MTFGEIEEIFLEQMPGFYDKEEIKAIASLAIQHTCGVTRSYVMLHKSTELLLSQETTLIRILDELRFGKPLQHVLGETQFYGLTFKVSPAVLVPRPETEELVDWIITSIKNDGLSSRFILDIGTGSACIPIALKKNIPESSVHALDISDDALDIARRNSELNDVEINLFKSDILNKEILVELPRYDIIVSNPPYITASEKTLIHKNVLNHEPHEALFVPDSEPLKFYDSIAEFSINHLSEQGYLFLEINERFGNETLALLQSKGFQTELRKDLQGKDRMIKAFKLSKT